MKSWLERAIETHNHHYTQVRTTPGWTYKDTARDLKRSVGSISQDLLVANGYTQFPFKLESLQHLQEALEFVRFMEKKSKSIIIIPKPTN